MVSTEETMQTINIEKSTNTAPTRDQPHLLKTPERLTDHRSRDAEVLGEFGFGREP